MNNIPDGMVLLDKEGKILKSLQDYNNTHVCIILNKDKISDFTVVGKYANNIMPNYLPRVNGVYSLVQDPEFDWLHWCDITSTIKALTLANIIRYNE